MKTMLDEIEAMIQSGNQRMLQHEDMIKSAVLKADEVFSAMQKPSQTIKKATKKKPEKKVAADIQICKNCNKEIRPGDSFCAGCGKKVEKTNQPEVFSVEIPLICSCGRPWQGSAQFCGACGAKRPVIEVTSHTCPNGHINTPASIFCYVCGDKII